MTVATTESRLQEELRELRRTVAALEDRLASRARIALVADEDATYLGERVRLRVKVTRDGDAEPLGGVPVTFTTTWGKLRAGEGFTLSEGASVGCRTFADGTATIELLPPTAEDLTESQRDALDAALARLDDEAATPAAVEAGLEEVARLYRWESGVQLRQAVDILFQNLRQGLVDTINRRDTATGWRNFEATVTAHVHGGPDDASSVVQASAVTTVRLRDWLEPWIEVYQRLAGEEERLSRDLAAARDRAAGTGMLLAELYGQVTDFLGRERGVVGDWIGRRVAATTVREFAATGTAELPLAIRVRIADGLSDASRTVTGKGMRALAGVARAQTDLDRKFETRIGQLDVDSIAGLDDRLGTIEGDVSLKVDATKFTTFQTTVNGNLAKKVDNTKFTAFQTTVNGNLAKKVDNTGFTTFQTTVNSNLAKKVDNTKFVTFQNEVNKKIANRAEISVVGNLTDTVGGLGQRVDFVESGLGTRASTEEVHEIAAGLGAEMERRAEAEEVRAREVGERLEGVEVRLSQKAEASQLRDVAIGFDRALQAKADTATVNSQLGKKLNSVTFSSFKKKVEKDVAKKVDISRFNQLQTTVKKNFGSLQTHVRNFQVIDTVVFDPVLVQPVVIGRG